MSLTRKVRQRGGRRRRLRGGRRRQRGGRTRTRASHRRRAASYRRHRRASPCRGKGPAVCRANRSCKYASGSKRSFCRRKSNTRRHRRRHH